MNEDLLTRLRKWHAANLPEDDSPYDPTDIKDMVPEVITYIEDLESALRPFSCDCKTLDNCKWSQINCPHFTGRKALGDKRC